MTAAEIAKIAGVSRSTVTRVMNNYPDTAEETRRKVLEVVEKYGYAPNASARSLVGKKAKEIGLFIHYAADDISQSVYFGSLITHVIDCAEHHDYSVLTSIIKPGQRGKISHFLNNESIQGAIVTGGAMEKKEALNLMESRHKIVVVDLVSYDSDLQDYCGLVNRDNFKGGYLATEYLIKHGHREIMHIAGALSRVSGAERLRGYETALQDHGIKLSKKLILKGDFSDATAEKLLEKYLKHHKPPTAIFAGNDMSAIGAMRVLKAKGYVIPKDVSIVGFDDIYFAKELEPKLTTISSPPKTIATTAVETLIKMIEIRDFRVSKTVIGVSLIERESVKMIS